MKLYEYGYLIEAMQVFSGNTLETQTLAESLIKEDHPKLFETMVNVLENAGFGEDEAREQAQKSLTDAIMESYNDRKAIADGGREIERMSAHRY